MGTQWAGMGRGLMQLPEFRESILRSDEALRDTGLCVSRLLMEADESTFEDTVHAFVGLAAIQVRRSGPPPPHEPALAIAARSLGEEGFNELSLIC